MVKNTFLRPFRQLGRFQLRRARHPKGRTRQLTFRPQLEQMEDRVVPATLTPALIRQAYGIDQIEFAGIGGRGPGQTIGIVEFNIDASLVSDLIYFDRQMFGPGPDGAELLDTFYSYTGPVQGNTK